MFREIGLNSFSSVSHFLLFTGNAPLKFVPAIFYQIFIYHQMIAIQKIWKMFFISSNKLFSFSRYSGFCIFVFSFFSLSAIALVVDPRKFLKVYDAINGISKNLLTHFVWYLKKEIGCDIKFFSIIRVSNKP